MSLLLLVVSALHILILILLFVATLDKVSLLRAAASALLQTPATPLLYSLSGPAPFLQHLPI